MHLHLLCTISVFILQMAVNIKIPQEYALRDFYNNHTIQLFCNICIHEVPESISGMPSTCDLAAL